MGKKKLSIPIYSDLDPRKFEKFSKEQRNNYLIRMKTLYSELNELETHYKDFCESKHKCSNCQNCRVNITKQYLITKAKLEKEHEIISDKLINLKILERIIFKMNMPSSEINNLDIPTLINLKTKVTVNDIFELLQKSNTVIYGC